MASSNPTHGKKLTIGFGLVNIALAMKPMHEARTRPSGKFLTTDMHQVKQCYRDVETGEILERSDLITGYAVPGTKDTFVTLDEAVVEAAADEKTGRMEITKVVPFVTVDPAHLSSTYICWAQDGSEVAYDLLSAVLKDSGDAAVATVVLTKTTQQVVLRWSEDLGVIIAHICEYSDAIRTSDIEAIKTTAAKRAEVAPEMLEMAKNLFSSLAGEFDATAVEDAYGAALTEAISAAANGVEIKVTDKKVAVKTDDLLNALQASVAAQADKKKAAKKVAA